ncbi:MAG: enoyl-CoA hydratase/isomerase family protein [Candidatus Bathyarchaeota archaeon]|nr:enoyl-CoA hydratase/isomerase family protein [Candidatus Bathyarchaeum sp.]
MMFNNFRTIKIHTDYHIAHLKLNRLNKLNAINSVMLQELSKAIDNVGKNKEIKCLIISGEGKKAFSAGADLKELQKLTPKKARKLSSKGKQVFSKIENMPKPVIASINGYALGGGLELALACNLRVATVDSQFGFPETKLGLIPGWGGTVRLPLIVGEKKAKQLITSGKHINAKEALKIGLVDDVFSLEDFESKTKALAQKLCDCPPLEESPLKKTLFSNSDHEKFDKETEVFVYRFSLPETKNMLTEVLSQRNKK